MKNVVATTIMSVVILFAAPVLAQGAGPKQVPNPALAPEEVVRIVMGALGKNDAPYHNHGIEVTFGFASPANRSVTGPVDRFAAMVRGPIYGPMIDHRGFQLENIQQSGDRAQVDVVLDAADGRKLGYRFILSRQRDNGFEGSWMTDGVAPFEVVSL